MTKTVYAYDSDGRLTEKTLYDYLGAPRYTSTWKYNSFGQVILEKDALGYIPKRRFVPMGIKFGKKRSIFH